MRGTQRINNKLTKRLRANGYTLISFANEMRLTVAGVYSRFRNKQARFSKEERLICEKYLGKEWEGLL
jgi:hypothetical protein